MNALQSSSQRVCAQMQDTSAVTPGMVHLVASDVSKHKEFVCAVSRKTFGSDTGNLEAVKALVEAGADVSLAADGGVTPLHAAAELGGIDLLKLLLKVLLLAMLPFALCVCPSIAFSVLAFQFQGPSLCAPLLSLHFGTCPCHTLAFAVVTPYVCLCLPNTLMLAFPGQFLCLSFIAASTSPSCFLWFHHAWACGHLPAQILRTGAYDHHIVSCWFVVSPSCCKWSRQRSPVVCDRILLKGLPTPAILPFCCPVVSC